jgi:PTH1 family peptidyl-tRNA hydrolase
VHFKGIKQLFHRPARNGEVPKWIIVGLGNPGAEYSRNRHNAGFMCINRLAKDIGADFDKKEGLARVARGKLGPVPVLLARPQTYMNLSGRAVVKLLERYRLGLDSVVVIHDDMDLKLGQIRIRLGGRSAGHRGVESVIGELDDQNFIRVRIGVGRPETDGACQKRPAVIDYVLDDFDAEESRVMVETAARVAEAIKTIVSSGLEEAMNRYNTPPGKTGGEKSKGASQ